VYADTKRFVYNYVKHVVLLMVMELAASKLFKKVPKPTQYRTHTYKIPHITKPTHTHTHTLQNPHIHTPTCYKTYTCTHPHIT